MSCHKRVSVALLAVAILLSVSVEAMASATNYQAMCASCHGKQGEGSLKLKAPSIAGLPDWYVLSQIEKIKSNTRAAGTNDVHLLAMRQVVATLDQDALNALAVYIKTLKPQATTNTLGGDPERGKALYANLCMECHRFNASGEKVFKSPPLTGLQDWYMASQFERYRELSRGPAKDVYGHKMHTVASRMENPKDLHDILAWIAEIAAEAAKK